MQVEISTPAKIPEKIQDTPANVYIVGRKDIERQGYNTISEILENVPGLYNIYNYNEMSGNFGIRGYWNGRSQNGSVAFLINGIPQMRPDTSSTPISSIFMPVEAIDRIEVIKGPNSVMYGNGAFFGAINIITNDFFHQDQASISHGSNATTRTALRWSTHFEDFNLVINAGHYSTDGLSPRLSELTTKRNVTEAFDPYIPDLNTSLDKMLEKETTYLQASGEWKNVYFDYVYNESDTEIFYVLPPVVDGSIDRTSYSRMTLGYKQQITPNTTWDTWANYSAFQSERDYDAIEPGIVAINDLEYDSWEVESILAYLPSSSFHVTLGFNWQRLQNLCEYTHIPSVEVRNETVDIDKRDTRSVFAQLNYEFSEKLRIIGGVRIEDLKGYARTVLNDTDEPDNRPQGDIKNSTPRVSLIYQASKNQQIKLMAGDATKLPYAQDDRFSSEEVRTLEVMYTLAKEDMLLTVSVFDNSMSNLLIESLDFDSNGSLATRTNPGNKVDTIGTEITLQKRIGERWRSELAVTFQDSEDRVFPERDVIYSPSTAAHGKLIYERNDISTSLLGRYVSGMTPFYNPNTLEPEGDKSGGYVVFDASIRFEEIWKEMYLSVKVNNLLDKTIRYPLNPINSSLLDRGTLAAGRTLQVTAGYKF